MVLCGNSGSVVEHAPAWHRGCGALGMLSGYPTPMPDFRSTALKFCMGAAVGRGGGAASQPVCR